MRLLCVSSMLLLALVPTAGYNDPQGRFSVQEPSGWKAVALGPDAVQIGSGSGYVTVMVFPAGDAGATLEGIARQAGSQWRGFAEARRGATRLGGLTGVYVTYAGTNPRGADAYLQMIAAADGAHTYLLMISAPKAEFAGYKPGFDKIEQSFLPGRGAAAEEAPVPSGARTAVQSGYAAREAARTAKTSPKPQAISAAPAPHDGVYRMKKVSVIDEHGFERPMPALSLLIPTDWQFGGNVQFKTVPGCAFDLAQTSFHAQSPDGRTSIEMLPSHTWQWADDRNTVAMLQAANQQTAQFGGKGCDVNPPLGAADYVQRVVLPSQRRGARVIGVEPLPEIAAEVQHKIRGYESAAAQNGIQVRMRGDVARVRIERDINGEAVEEWVTAITFAAGMPGPTFNMMTAQMGQSLFYTCGAEAVFILRAPRGQLDAKEKFFNLVLSTVHANGEWQSRVAQVQANIQASQSKGARDRANIWAQNGRDIDKIIHDTYATHTAAEDRAAVGFSQYIRGVETYRNPQTGETVALSNQYGHAWVNNRGEYLMSDSASFNPNVTLNGGWTSLEPVKK